MKKKKSNNAIVHNAAWRIKEQCSNIMMTNIRVFTLFIAILYVTIIGPSVMNWISWEQILLVNKVYSWLCENENGSSSCNAQKKALSFLHSFSHLSMSINTFIGGFLLDILGPKTTSIIGLLSQIIGWSLLAAASSTFNCYLAAFGFIAAGVDPSFLGTISIINLFPHRKATIISVLGAARSMSYVTAILVRFFVNEVSGLTLTHIGIIYIVCIVIISFYPIYLLPKAKLIVLKPVEDFDSDSHQISIKLAKQNVKLMNICSEVTVNKLEYGKSDSIKNQINIQVKRLLLYLIDPVFACVTIIAVLNVLRFNYYIHSASFQLEHKAHVIEFLYIFSFLPTPLCGFLSDKFGATKVIFSFNIVATMAYLSLLLAEAFPSHCSLFHYVSISCIYPYIGILFNQIYCLISQIYPAKDLGKLVGLCCCIAGIIQLSETFMLRYAVESGSFVTTNILCCVFGLIIGILCVFLHYATRKKI